VRTLIGTVVVVVLPDQVGASLDAVAVLERCEGSVDGRAVS
jgi:hypothetical protein